MSYEATIRHLQQRMLGEGLKDPSSEEGSNNGSMDNSDDPALDNNDCSAQHQTIYTSGQCTEPTHPSTTTNGNNTTRTTSSGEHQQQQDSEAYARHVEEQARLLSQFSGMNVGGPVENDDVDPAEDQLVVDSRPSDGSSSGEQVWGCDACGYESNSLMHRFCGLCGMERAEDWYCFDCQYENNAVHRFCGLCGQCRPGGASAASLGYEDLGLDPDDEAAIQNTASRMSQHHHATTAALPTATIIHPGAPGSHQWDDDDVLTFAEESCADDGCGGRQQHHQQLSPRLSEPPPPPQQQPPQQQQSKSWSCGVCTFLNENPLFMCCEMCGSARPAQQGLAEVADDTTTPSGPPPPPGPEKSRPPPLPSSTSNTSDTGPKKAEKKIAELMRQQQLEEFQREQGGGAGQETQLPEPEMDHELALIYAQQERILAQYQQQQEQQQQQQQQGR